MKRVDDSVRWALSDLYADYAACLDSGTYTEWPGFFVENCRYRVVPRENYDRNLPLSTIDLHGIAMLRDRLYGVTSTLFHAPYYQRHVIGPLRMLDLDGETLKVEANYIVVRTKRDTMSEVYNAGRYVDIVKLEPGGPRFVEKICVFDSELIPNSLIYPI
jgi:salicylate 5-hydroxylase small subunit